MGRNFQIVADMWGADELRSSVDMVNSWYERPFLHTLAHVPMLHGVVPDAVLPHSSTAFLGPAWSISLEWQFYLIAPLCYIGLTRFGTSGRVVVVGILGGVLALRASGLIPWVELGAFLPFHLEFFAVGIGSFFVWRALRGGMLPWRLTLPAAAAGVCLVVALGNDALPTALWVFVLGVLIDVNNGRLNWVSRLSSRSLGNPGVQFLGKVSYSLYLCHTIVIVLVQTALFEIARDLDQTFHIALLLVVSLPLSIAASTFLYLAVEKPCIEAGRRIARRVRMAGRIRTPQADLVRTE
jgi:peptidoglycan/LPS O-acetylase OafA/YrhL